MIALYNNERENQFIVMNFGTAFTLLMGVGILAWAVDVQTKEVKYYCFHNCYTIIQSKKICRQDFFFAFVIDLSIFK